MGKSNGKSDVEKAGLDLEHELPSGDGGEGVSEAASRGPSAVVDQSDAEAELQKLKSERDALLDRLARAQAEFENARRRAAKEQQEYRDFATSDALKSLLPVIDSFERALQVKSEGSEFRSGIELIYKQLQDVLAKLGLHAIAAKGQRSERRY